MVPFRVVQSMVHAIRTAVPLMALVAACVPAPRAPVVREVPGYTVEVQPEPMQRPPAVPRVTPVKPRDAPLDFVAYGNIVVPRHLATIGCSRLVTDRDVAAIVRFYEGLYGVDSAVICAVIKVESNFDPRAVSRKGALGLMQLMPGTARSLGVKDPFHPVQNVAGGTLYLALLAREFGNNARLVLAAYNAGPDAVRRYGGVPPYAETQAFVDQVLAYRKWFAPHK